MLSQPFKNLKHCILRDELGCDGAGLHNDSIKTVDLAEMPGVGARLEHYEILSPLGAGGMGEVWRARDTRLNREVAIKILPASCANDADRLRRFEQEALATSALNRDRSKDQPAREINDGRAAKKIISYVGCIFDLNNGVK